MKSVFWGLGKKSGKNGGNAGKIGSCRKKVERHKYMKSVFWGLGKGQEKMAERLEKLVVAGKKWNFSEPCIYLMLL